MNFTFTLYVRWGDEPAVLPVKTIPALLEYVETDEFTAWLLARYARARLFRVSPPPTSWWVTGLHGPRIWKLKGPTHADFRLFSELAVDSLA